MSISIIRIKRYAFAILLILSAHVTNIRASDNYIELHEEIAEIDKNLFGSNRLVTDPLLNKIKDAASRGNAEAAWAMYSLYWWGDGVEKNRDTAMEWLSKAEDKRFDRALCSKGIRYLYGDSFPYDFQKAADYFIMSLEESDYCSTYLGWVYSIGDGTLRNTKKGIDLLKYASKNKTYAHDVAERLLGFFHFEGELVVQNYEESIAWYKKAEPQNNSDAIGNLGYMYDFGYGVDINKVKATRKYQLAAELGNVHAQVNASSNYSHGIGVEKSNTHCYVWSSVAIATNTDESKKRAVEHREWCSSQLSAAELKAAQNIARSAYTGIYERKWNVGSEAIKLDATATQNLPPLEFSPSDDLLDSKQVFNEVSHSVYTIRTASSPAFFPANDGKTGSAVAITPNLLVTNCHVLTGYSSIAVMDNKSINYHLAKVVKHSSESDMCVLQTIEPVRLIPHTRFRTLASLNIGESLYSIGSPRGLSLTIADGVLSGIRTRSESTLIQTTAPISPGSSGGALFDAYGNLIGITTLYLQDSQNLNFAIPIESFWNENLYDAGGFTPGSTSTHSLTPVISASESVTTPAIDTQGEIDRLQAEIDSEAVKTIQRQLNALNCNAGTVDGIYGRQTQQALAWLMTRNPSLTSSLNLIFKKKNYIAHSDTANSIANTVSFNCY